MIRAVHQEFRPARDGAEFADFQPVAVDGIVIKNVVPLEFRRVPREIVVDGKRPDFNHGILHGVPQIDGLSVPAAGVELRGIWNRHSISFRFL